jgi:YfiH family protein
MRWVFISFFMEYYLNPKWPAPINVHAFTTTRLHSSLEKLKLPSEPVYLQQVHGSAVVCLDNTSEHLPADAAFTTKPNVVCVVRTADCLPILLCNEAGTKVAAIHAGWRGLAAGVIENTLQAIQAPGEKLLVWLGPAIGPEAFEVGDEVKAQFVQHDPAAASAFKQQKHGKWQANIYELAKQRLNLYNVTSVFGGEFDTYNDDRFFSYRREGVKAGRMASLIWFQKE